VGWQWRFRVSRCRKLALRTWNLGLLDLGTLFFVFGLRSLHCARSPICFDTLQVAVGAYAGDYGFPLPNPVSIHPEYSRLRFRVPWCMQTLQKLKILGVECSGITDAEDRGTPADSPESIQGCSDMDGTPHISGGNPNVLNVNRYDGERWVSTYWGYPDSQWNDNGAFAFPVAATPFTSRPAIRGVEFCLAARSNHPAFYRFLQSGRRAQRISSYRVILSPRARVTSPSGYPVCEWRAVPMAVFRF